MRNGFRRRGSEDEEESVFISMTDMTVSFLFIVMILLAFFASQISLADENDVPRATYERAVQERDRLRLQLDRALEELDRLRNLTAEQERQIVALEDQIRALKTRIAELERELEEARKERRNLLEEYFAAVSAERAKLLERLRQAILADFPDLEIKISSERDALRFQGEGLFHSGQSTIRPDRHALVRKIAEKLDELLPCYTTGPRARFSESCNPAFALIEAVQIEGHTDSDGSDSDNIDLSARRGANTYAAMTEHLPAILDHRNLEGQPVLSVAGYGENRPVTANDTPQGKSANRRIDLRFIMVSPRASSEIAAIRDSLRDATAAEAAE